MSTSEPSTPPPAPSVSGLYPDWPQYATRFVAGVRDLTAPDLAIRAAAGHAPIWALAAHVAGSRAYWLCGVLGEPGADATPFTDPASGLGWEDDESHPRSGTELAWALESTWAVAADCLARWTISGLGDVVERRQGDAIQHHTRGSILNRLVSHDAFHAGEISQLLGVHGLPEIDLWARDRSRP